jgi:hypothetical protein
VRAALPQCAALRADPEKYSAVREAALILP